MIFVTGPSGVGKSFLVQAYHTAKARPLLLSVNTRPLRPHELEHNRTIPKDDFLRRQKNGELCLVSNNHGNLYAYVVSEIADAGPLAMIEVDSKTAVLEQRNFNATIVRISQSEEGHRIVQENILRKRDEIDLRMKEYREVTSSEFLAQRKAAGDIFFQNDFDDASFKRFAHLIDEIISK